MKDSDDLAKRVENLFGQKVYLHSQDAATGEHVVLDTSDNEVSRKAAHVNPFTGKSFNVMRIYAVRLLKNAPQVYLCVGDITTVTYVPHGAFFIDSPDGVYNTDGKLGVDFELLDIPANRNGYNNYSEWLNDPNVQK